MPRMTEEEADALDDLVTKTPPRVDPSKARYVCRMASPVDFSVSDANPGEIAGYKNAAASSIG